MGRGLYVLPRRPQVAHCSRHFVTLCGAIVKYLTNASELFSQLFVLNTLKL